MRQEVQATVELSLDADADLSPDQLRAALVRGLSIANPFWGSTIEVVGVTVSTLKEEAEIYGNL